MIMLHHTDTFLALCTRLPPELVRCVFEFWIGYTHTDRIPNHTLAYQFGRYEFPEGINWCLREHSTDEIVLNQLLYGSATNSDVALSLRILQHGATDLETAVNLALERGFLWYVRQMLYYCNQPSVPLSIPCWIRYCKKNQTR
jgi:hypothetical protein